MSGPTLTGLFQDASLLSVLYQLPAFPCQPKAATATGGSERPRQGAGVLNIRHEGVFVSAFGEDRMSFTLYDINLLHATPSRGEIRAAWVVMGVLLVGCAVTIPFATHQWPASNVLYAAAGIAAFAEMTTGVLLLTQAMLLRQQSGLALGLGYLVGGLVIVVNLLGARDVATRLWLFRLWHGVFVLGVLAYAVLAARSEPGPAPASIERQARLAISGAVAFAALLIMYLFFRPFPLPVIIHSTDYATGPDLLVNGVQLAVMVAAWVLLLTARRKTVLSVWMGVVACAVAIDIVLFVLGTTLFSVGLYVSKLNNFLAATLVFGVIFYRYIRIQAELYKHRTELMEANHRLAQLALTDPLTDLPNRAALDQALERALTGACRTDKRVAVCVIDLDDFKPVNDRYGHETGDRLLRAFSERVSGVLRKGEYFARLGGDEFVMVLENLNGRDEVDSVMKRISDALSKPFVFSPELVLFVSASIGVAVSSDLKDGSDLMRAADQTLYRVKANKADRERIWAIDDSAAGVSAVPVPAD
ncbi:MAG: sensor domain-containing diguanylate cyclase [Gammaproteobacteria bacterium]